MQFPDVSSIGAYVETPDGGHRMVTLRHADGTHARIYLTSSNTPVVLPAPPGVPLLLDVIGTDAVRIPVLAGQSVHIILDAN